MDRMPFLTASVSRTRPAGTYSIVAYDATAGQIGVAVQSHWFAVGASIAWAEAGIGAVATQSFIEPSYGPSGLNLMRGGRSASEALAALVAQDAMREVRQVAMIDAKGHVAAHTGQLCVPEAGQIVGTNYSVQANMMASAKIWPLMEQTFARSGGDLAERLLLTLEAAEAAGGDIRGRQSAALLVVRSQATGLYSSDRLFDLRVDDHPQPLTELRRLVGLARAYAHMNHGDDLYAQGQFAEAGQAYQQASQKMPDVMEPRFWQAVALIADGAREEARPILARVFSLEPQWRQLLLRLPAAGLLPSDPALIEDLVAIKS
ncbi:MAG: DUF1028 domain-containing protein [Desulfobacterales bacterium]|nr:MAG: DUF1028 domain-containing protein [Desulfobacterales bacterium]